MSESKQTKQASKNTTENKNEGREELGNSPMMAHLLDALEKGTDIGHYGCLTFVMIARHFLSEDEMVQLLSHQPDHNAEEARALVRQVKAHDYNPPKRERILEWQSRQDFPICPTPDEPGTCNVYQELRFPEGIYDNISEYYEEQVKAEERSGSDSA
jgi:DNA primase large subunit